MIDLTYYRYILRFVKNSICPDIDYKIYNNQQAREIKKKALKDHELIKDDFNCLSLSYDYLLSYINDFIKYFNIDASKYNKLNQYLTENIIYILH